MKKILKKVNETGTLLVEAMAMLGLIAMVTPVLYKKASERTVELQDVNASSQLRALSTALDGYLKDNFARITKGEKITNSIDKEIDFSDFKNATDGQVGPVDINRFADYLPYGFLDGENARETKLFTKDYKVIIKLESDIKDGKVMSQTLTGFVTATPKIPDEIGNVRASRIASMIGSNGGYVITEDGGQVAMGAQGIWSVPTSEFDGVTLADNTFVVSSVQPISSQGLANEDVLHRKNEPDAADELNTMETDLFMGYSDGDTRNIRLVNQIIMHPNVDRMVKGGDVASTREEDFPADTLDPAGFSNTLDKALYIAKGGGAYMEGALQAMNSLFTVKEDGIKYYGSNSTSTTDPNTGNTTTTTTRANDPTLKIDGTELVYGDPGAGKAKLTVKSAGSMSFGTSAVPANGGTPAQAGVESLYADKTNFRAGDGNLNMTKDGTDWYTVIKKDAAGNATAHEGGRSTYTWNGAVPTEDAAEKTGKYEVSINGSAFVKDTMLTGKLKSFNVDAATLRAGVDPNEFDAAKNDTDFYTVTRRGSFIAGKDTIPMLTVSEDEYEDGEGRLIPRGITLSTTDESSLTGVAAGIDISAGSPNMKYYNGSRYTSESIPIDNMVRIAGENGVNISTTNRDSHNADDEYRYAPVSIQEEMFRAYHINGPYEDANSGASRSGIFKNIDMYTDQVNFFPQRLFSSNNDYDSLGGKHNYYRFNTSSLSYGRVYMANTGLILADSAGKPIIDMHSYTNRYFYPAARIAGGFAIYDHDYNMKTKSDRGNGEWSLGPVGADAAVFVNKGTFQIRSTNSQYQSNDTQKDIEYITPTSYLNNNVRVFTVDSGGADASTTGVSNSNRLSKNGSVYIRRGSMALESNVDEDKNRKLTNAVINNQYINGQTNAVGYIAADRFISHYKPSDILSSSNIGNEGGYATGGGTKAYVPYDGYEVNPAYTSVMHDIKLTTRGGARLSDILPDFINKGIYVVDTTYAPTSDWVPTSPNIPDTDIENGDATQEVSPYAGFIPTPKCPPGYGMAITLTPAGWNMATAGTAMVKTMADGSSRLDIVPHYDIENYNQLDETTGDRIARPMEYQKSTWLKAMVLPYCGAFYDDAGNIENKCNKESFRGWGAILGFIYPEAYWNDALDIVDGDNQDGMYWNLFPVYYRELEGYATVYCYFDRSSFDYDEVYNDYDQLNNHATGSANSYKKDGDDATTYINRLNDPKLKYYDPW